MHDIYFSVKEHLFEKIKEISIKLGFNHPNQYVRFCVTRDVLLHENGFMSSKPLEDCYTDDDII